MRRQMPEPTALRRYFDGEDVRLDDEEFDEITSGLRPFTRQVLREVCRIPRGTTITYGELARRIGRPDAVRATAAALGRNPLPILIPCHRVVSVNGIGGYAFGVELKTALLNFERGERTLFC